MKLNFKYQIRTGFWHYAVNTKKKYKLVRIYWENKYNIFNIFEKDWTPIVRKEILK